MDKFDFDALRLSSLEQTLFNKRFFPEEDCLKVPAIQVLEQRKILQDAEEDLQNNKTTIKMKMEALALRRGELNKKTTQLKESLKKFDKFLKDNEAKKMRAIRKAVDERKLRDKKELELVQLKQEIVRLESDRVKQSKSLRKNLNFQSYLENILDKGSNFTELKDIITRHETLAATNFELSKKTVQVQESTESLRKDFELRSEEGNNKILNCNNEIARLQARLEELKHNTAQMQQDYDGMIAKQLHKSLQTNQINQAIANLFSLMKTHVGQRLVPTNGPLMQLERLQTFMVDLDEVIQYIQRESAAQQKQNTLQANLSLANIDSKDKSEFKKHTLTVKRLPVVAVTSVSKNPYSSNASLGDQSSTPSSAHSSHYGKSFWASRQSSVKNDHV